MAKNQNQNQNRSLVGTILFRTGFVLVLVYVIAYLLDHNIKDKSGSSRKIYLQAYNTLYETAKKVEAKIW